MLSLPLLLLLLLLLPLLPILLPVRPGFPNCHPSAVRASLTCRSCFCDNHKALYMRLYTAY